MGKEEVLQSWQGQGARVGQEQLDKESRKITTAQEEKLELLEVRALPVFQRVTPEGPWEGAHTSHPATAQPLVQHPMGNIPAAQIPKEPSWIYPQGAFIEGLRLL